jgi:hypothetical protein
VADFGAWLPIAVCVQYCAVTPGDSGLRLLQSRLIAESFGCFINLFASCFDIFAHPFERVAASKCEKAQQAQQDGKKHRSGHPDLLLLIDFLPATRAISIALFDHCIQLSNFGTNHGVENAGVTGPGGEYKMSSFFRG